MNITQNKNSVYDECFVNVDAYCVSHDIDDYDLHGTRFIESSDEESDIRFE